MPSSDELIVVSHELNPLTILTRSAPGLFAKKLPVYSPDAWTSRMCGIFRNPARIKLQAKLIDIWLRINTPLLDQNAELWAAIFESLSNFEIPLMHRVRIAELYKKNHRTEEMANTDYDELYQNEMLNIHPNRNSSGPNFSSLSSWIGFCKTSTIEETIDKIPKKHGLYTKALKLISIECFTKEILNILSAINELDVVGYINVYDYLAILELASSRVPIYSKLAETIIDTLLSLSTNLNSNVKLRVASVLSCYITKTNSKSVRRRCVELVSQELNQVAVGHTPGRALLMPPQMQELSEQLTFLIDSNYIKSFLRVTLLSDYHPLLLVYWMDKMDASSADFLWQTYEKYLNQTFLYSNYLNFFLELSLKLSVGSFTKMLRSILPDDMHQRLLPQAITNVTTTATLPVEEDSDADSDEDSDNDEQQICLYERNKSASMQLLIACSERLSAVVIDVLFPLLISEVTKGELGQPNELSALAIKVLIRFIENLAKTSSYHAHAKTEIILNKLTLEGISSCLVMNLLPHARIDQFKTILTIFINSYDKNWFNYPKNELEWVSDVTHLSYEPRQQLIEACIQHLSQYNESNLLPPLVRDNLCKVFSALNGIILTPQQVNTFKVITKKTNTYFPILSFLPDEDRKPYIIHLLTLFRKNLLTCEGVFLKNIVCCRLLSVEQVQTLVNFFKAELQKAKDTSTLPDSEIFTLFPLLMANPHYKPGQLKDIDPRFQVLIALDKVYLQYSRSLQKRKIEDTSQNETNKLARTDESPLQPFM